MVQSVKALQDAAERERQKAQAQQLDASSHREQANKMDGRIDPQIPLKENERAQRTEESAMQHSNAADELSRKAAVIQNKIVELERLKQRKQVAHQAEIDRIDAEIAQLRG